MPIYEYQCSSCGHEESALEKMDAPRVKQCPACGSGELQRLVSAAGFQLKGSGWYQTDFKDSGKPKPAARKDGNKDAPDSDGKEGKKKEKKAGSESSGKASRAADGKDAKPKTGAPAA